MYESFHVRNYRGLQKLDLEGLADVNLIAGSNNVGKTALLESLFVFSGTYNPGLLLVVRTLRGHDRLKIQRGSWAESPFATFFFNRNESSTVAFSGYDVDRGLRSVEISVVRDLSKVPQVPQYSLTEQDDEAKEPPSSIQVAGSSEIVHALQLDTSDGGASERYFLVLTMGKVHTVPFYPPPPFQTYLIRPYHSGTTIDSELFSNLAKQGNEEVLLAALRLIEPQLIDVFLVTEADQTRLWGRLPFGSLPVLDMGDGLIRLANIAIRAANAPGGILLIDEIENGLHYSVLPQVWSFIARISKEFDVQIIATTHSRECISAAHRVFLDNQDSSFRLFRLQRQKDLSIRAVGYDQDALDVALQTGLEVR